MAITTWDPWSEFSRLRHELAGRWTPAADVTCRPDSVEVSLDLPGMTADDVTVELRGHQLVIRGERTGEREEKGADAVRRERTFGCFLRTFPLPAGVDADDVRARFDHGELKVRVTLPAQPQPKTIAIETGRPTPV
jgi:HSP20 family protein